MDHAERIMQWEEIEVTMGELKDGDRVKGSDGQWYDVEVLPVHTPSEMYKITLSNGRYVKCSGDHMWTLFDQNTGMQLALETSTIYKNLEFVRQCGCGEPDGPSLVKVEPISPEPCRCITMKGAEDMLFEIIADIDEEWIAENAVNQKLDVERNEML